MAAPTPATTTYTEPMYIFGYGSLLFKQNFKFSRMMPARVKGFIRVFYQGSTDHRGVPGAPGRVVTLIHAHEYHAALAAAAPMASSSSSSLPVSSPTSVPHETASHDAAHCNVFVDGYVFEVQPEDIEATIQYLDIREQGGYDRLTAPAYAMKKEKGEEEKKTADEEDEVLVKECVLYIANPTNDEYLGYADEAAIAAQIMRCHGPSGPNREYLFKLADALRAMGAVDEHVYLIEHHAKKNLVAEEAAKTEQ